MGVWSWTWISVYEYKLQFDNFFKSINLVHVLSAMGIGAVGTVRINHLFNCQPDKVKRGAMDYMYDSAGRIAVVRWMDNASVTTLPLHSASRLVTTAAARINIQRLHIIKLYNKSMGWTDLMDQNISAYRICMKIKKLWRPHVPCLIDAAAQKVWLIYRLTPGYQSNKRICFPSRDTYVGHTLSVYELFLSPEH